MKLITLKYLLKTKINKFKIYQKIMNNYNKKIQIRFKSLKKSKLVFKKLQILLKKH